jgi:hypothetical protein
MSTAIDYAARERQFRIAFQQASDAALQAAEAVGHSRAALMFAGGPPTNEQLEEHERLVREHVMAQLRYRDVQP